jgi:hypothetical protein
VTTPILWPRRLLVPRKPPAFTPLARTTSGGATDSGLGQVIASDAGYWIATFKEVVVHDADGEQRILTWKAIEGMVEGRAYPLIMPVDVSGRRPLPVGVTDADIDEEESTPHDDDSMFDDGSGYLNTWIDVTAAKSAPPRATTLSLSKKVCGTIMPGMDFSISQRLYRIKKVLAQTASTAMVMINFPLREAVPMDSFCDFALPVCLMRLMTDDEMAIELETGRYAFPTVNLVEWL